MMRLKFSIEDILKGSTSLESNGEMNSCHGGLVDGKRTVTSDGESIRSESPDSTTSLNSDDTDRKGGRRIRTMIQHWQKEFLETAFSSHQYPTVHQYESLSKQLGLPHYVTKVWFQNRRSKSRKEGTREEHRRKCEPYPTPEQENKLGARDELKQRLQEKQETVRMRNMRNASLFLNQQRSCDCRECVAVSAGATALEQNPLLVYPHQREVCNCADCINEVSLEDRLSPQSSTGKYKYQQHAGLHQQQQQQICRCEDCLEEVARMRGVAKKLEESKQMFKVTDWANRVMTQMEPRNGSMAGPNTLHYWATPNAGNYGRTFDDVAAENCSCDQCRSHLNISRF